MCADQFDLAKDCDELVKAGIDFFHLDVMDGRFVPNITLGLDVCNAIKRRRDAPVDIHLLVKEPEKIISRLNIGEGDILSVHFESDADLKSLSEIVHFTGARFGITLNPETDISELNDLLDDIDVVNLMMIRPGFAGLAMEDGMIEKIAKTREYLDSGGHSDIPLEIDGHVSFDNAPSMREAGGQIFVAGSSSIFFKEGSIADNAHKLRSALECS